MKRLFLLAGLGMVLLAACTDNPTNDGQNPNTEDNYLRAKIGRAHV